MIDTIDLGKAEKQQQAHPKKLYLLFAYFHWWKPEDYTRSFYHE